MIFLTVVAMADEACVGHCARAALAGGALVPVETNGPPVWHVVVALAFALLALVALAVALPWIVGLTWTSSAAVAHSAIGQGQGIAVCICPFLGPLGLLAIAKSFCACASHGPPTAPGRVSNPLV